MRRFCSGKIPFACLLFPLLLTFCVCQASGKTSRPFTNGSIGNQVWIDKNANGLQEIDEPGFFGVTVVLLDENDNTITTTQTNTAGQYAFTDIDAGTAGKSYRVWFKLPSLYRFSPRIGVVTDATNSDADLLTGKTTLFTLLPGQALNDIDAGLIAPESGTLPLHRLLLSAQLQGESVKLTFEAENEMNTSHFVVQRSTDGANFTDVADVAVSGPVNIPTTYTHISGIHTLLSQKIIYYRIKAMDNSSRSAYSNVAAIRLGKLSGIRVWPAPFDSQISLSYNNSNGNTILAVSLTDNSGRQAWTGVYEASRGLNQFSINGLGRLPAGTYYIRVTDKNSGQSFVEQLIK